MNLFNNNNYNNIYHNNNDFNNNYNINIRPNIHKSMKNVNNIYLMIYYVTKVLR